MTKDVAKLNVDGINKTNIEIEKLNSSIDILKGKIGVIEKNISEMVNNTEIASIKGDIEINKLALKLVEPIITLQSDVVTSPLHGISIWLKWNSLHLHDPLCQLAGSSGSVIEDNLKGEGNKEITGIAEQNAYAY